MTAPKLPLLPADTTQLTFRDLRAYGLACYRQGLESAAKVCGDAANLLNRLNRDSEADETRACEVRIRAMAEEAT